MDSWWETPLCRRFLKDISGIINNGHIVLIYSPKHIPSRFQINLKNSLNQELPVKFQKVDLAGCTNKGSYSIESFLYSLFEIEGITDNFIEKRASAIFSHIPTDWSQIIVFENIDIRLLPNFKDFITDLGRYNASLPLHKRHKVLAILDPTQIKQDDLVQETGIQKIHFQNYWGKLDNLLAIRYYHSQSTDIMSDFTENFIASISRFDSKLVEILVENTNLLEDYPSILKDYAEKRDWTKIKYKSIEDLSDQDIWERWADGIIDFNKNEIYYHPAYLIIHNRKEEFNTIIKKATIEVLLPEIEEFRITLVKSDKIVLPFKAINKFTSEIIEDKFDFEIGSICHMVNTHEANTKWLSKGERKLLYEFINLCKSIRNDLSHVKIPKYEDIRKFYLTRKDIYSILQMRNT